MLTREQIELSPEEINLHKHNWQQKDKEIGQSWGRGEIEGDEADKRWLLNGSLEKYISNAATLKALKAVRDKFYEVWLSDSPLALSNLGNELDFLVKDMEVK